MRYFYEIPEFVFRELAERYRTGEERILGAYKCRVVRLNELAGFPGAIGFQRLDYGRPQFIVWLQVPETDDDVTGENVLLEAKGDIHEVAMWYCERPETTCPGSHLNPSEYDAAIRFVNGVSDRILELEKEILR